MTVFFSADLHLGHKNIHKYRKDDFESLGVDLQNSEQHDEFIMYMLSDSINKRYTYWFLGDIAFDLESIIKLKSLENFDNQFRIVLGNHDTERGVTAKHWTNSFSSVYGVVKYKEFWLSHVPIHETELRGRKNIHGHSHSYSVPDNRYMCVSLEQTNFKLKSLDQIREEFNEYEQHTIT